MIALAGIVPEIGVVPLVINAMLVVLMAVEVHVHSAITVNTQDTR